MNGKNKIRIGRLIFADFLKYFFNQQLWIFKGYFKTWIVNIPRFLSDVKLITNVIFVDFYRIFLTMIVVFLRDINKQGSGIFKGYF